MSVTLSQKTSLEKSGNFEEMFYCILTCQTIYTTFPSPKLNRYHILIVDCQYLELYFIKIINQNCLRYKVRIRDIE